jgi:hypothetical protein
MRACMITPGAHEPGGAATVKRPARPRGVWFGRTDTPVRLLQNLRDLIQSTRVGIDQAVNSALVLLYWQVSRRITVLSQMVGARSAVGCMNSVLRMHQARHRTMTQGLLDLKRLYWICWAFRGGKREGFCPYERLGLKLLATAFRRCSKYKCQLHLLKPRQPREQKMGLRRLTQELARSEFVVWDDPSDDSPDMV